MAKDKPHWLDDGPHYDVSIEAVKQSPGSRLFVSFFETEELAKAKDKCVSEACDVEREAIVFDRWLNETIFRHVPYKGEDEKVEEDAPKPKLSGRRGRPKKLK